MLLLCSTLAMLLHIFNLRRSLLICIKNRQFLFFALLLLPLETIIVRISFCLPVYIHIFLCGARPAEIDEN